MEQDEQETPGRERRAEGQAAARMLRAVLKAWPFLVAAALLGAGVAMAVSKAISPVYEAVTTIEFDPQAVRPLTADKSTGLQSNMLVDTAEYYNTQNLIMSSDKVLAMVVRDLNLTTDPEFLKGPASKPVTTEDAVLMLRPRVKVDPLLGSHMVALRVQDSSPRMARKLSEAVARAYIRQNLEKSSVATAEAVVWLGGQLDHYKIELEANENQLHDFKSRNQLPSSTLDEVSKMIRIEMADYQQALTRTRTRRQELAARVAELRKVDSDNPDRVPASEFLTNSYLTQLRNAFQTASRERRELVAEGRGENHPSVKKADEKISAARKDLHEEVRNIQGAIERDLAVVQRQEGGEATLYEGSRKKAVELNLKELEYRRLDRTRSENEKVYTLLLEQMKRADLVRMMNVNNVRMVDPAQEPMLPLRPNVPVNVGVGAVAALMLAVVFALVRERLDNSVKGADDVENELHATFLGLLPTGSAAAKEGRRPRRGADEQPPELTVHYEPLSGVAEAARALRTNLLFMNPDHPYRVMLVTSAVPAEGKTTVACSIAIALAQGGQRVCIIDCDLRRPRLHRIFDRAGDAGLTNALVGDATLDEIALPTLVPNLSSIPAGPIPPNPADMLHSERFKNLLAELAGRFDRIVIDSPPLAAVTDSAIIAKLVDGTVFVVRAFRTSVSMSQLGLRALTDVDANVIGCVLNAVDYRKASSHYYQYYAYRNEGYRADEPLKGGESVAPSPN
ncbi:MAG: polysaccharide biosynthesis tyrosine autokinase [Myxococcales bacterium]|nr:polysaccharide biosynthesis tyrosine autokinase [Myxococcales bacterium]MBL0193405.1 polysaccharide biosynthesis tyrosine autokinase [Myxococcales bacterium]HQY62495.1 polysaccharide biosynthesis tyrosine autokinase [Polyangiaceae bacterium]